jgi:hypothetical protein
VTFDDDTCRLPGHIVSLGTAMVWNIVEVLRVPKVWKGNENFANTTNFAKNTAIKKAAENKHMALWHAGVIKKGKFKEETCLKNINTASWG